MSGPTLPPTPNSVWHCWHVLAKTARPRARSGAGSRGRQFLLPVGDELDAVGRRGADDAPDLGDAFVQVLVVEVAELAHDLGGHVRRPALSWRRRPPSGPCRKPAATASVVRASRFSSGLKRRIALPESRRAFSASSKEGQAAQWPAPRRPGSPSKCCNTGGEILVAGIEQSGQGVRRRWAWSASVAPGDGAARRRRLVSPKVTARVIA